MGTGLEKSSISDLCDPPPRRASRAFLKMHGRLKNY
jgi:hypothetical protein